MDPVSGWPAQHEPSANDRNTAADGSWPVPEELLHSLRQRPSLRPREAGADAFPPTSGTRTAPVSHAQNDAPLHFPRPPRPARPADLPPELQQRWKELLDHHDALPKLDHFALLGIGYDARVQEVQRAFTVQAKRWHPDQFSGQLVLLKPYAMRILARLNVARRLLSDRTEREDYLGRIGHAPAQAPKPLTARTGEPTDAQSAEAAQLLEQAIGFSRKKCHDRALAAIEAARALDDRRADAVALHAWLLYERDGQPATASERTRRLLQCALQRDDGCEAAHFYQAVVLKRGGDVEQAVNHFRRVVEINPGHIDAARELRLHSARQAGARPGRGLLRALWARARK